jgi:uncharacterized membrane protein YwaF
MHTLMMTAAGILLLGMFLLLARFWVPDRGILAVAARAFVPVWLSLTLVNLWIGVAYAGYTVFEELPILAIAFCVPAAAAALIIMRSGGRRRR